MSFSHSPAFKCYASVNARAGGKHVLRILTRESESGMNIAVTIVRGRGQHLRCCQKHYSYVVPSGIGTYTTVSNYMYYYSSSGIACPSVSATQIAEKITPLAEQEIRWANKYYFQEG